MVRVYRMATARFGKRYRRYPKICVGSIFSDGGCVDSDSFPPALVELIRQNPAGGEAGNLAWGTFARQDQVSRKLP